MKVTVITISDRASKGIYDDLSGFEIIKILKKEFPDAQINKIIVPDEKVDILSTFKSHLDSDFIITTGGTGISPRDVTPDITEEFCEKALPGISEILRAESYKETPFAMLSRTYSGIKGKTIIINFPGSVKAVKLCTQKLIPIMQHAGKMMEGKGH